jgi:TPP-dependent pyruvate/acetoin dehydrogenase alpha subunit
MAPGDWMTSTHRGHHHLLARGVPAEGMLAEILGRSTGVSHGMGGSMHMADASRHVVGTNGIVGGGIPHAVGLAIAAQTLGTGACAVAFFGDGAANQGTFHESLNLAAIWHAPVVFVCENNGYGEFSASEAVTAGPGIARRADAYGIPGEIVDGNDVLAVRAAALTALQRARAGEGPTLLECRCVRRRGHHEGEETYARGYRPDGFDPATDPIDRLAGRLPDGLARRDELAARHREELLAALDRARAAPFPDPATVLQELQHGVR